MRLLALFLLVSSAAALNTSCCFGCCLTSDLRTIPGCACSTFENTALEGNAGYGSELTTTFDKRTLVKGEDRTYHWELKNYSLVNHDTDAYITFDLSTTGGEADLDLNLGDMLSHEFLPTYNVTSTGPGTISMVRAKLRYGEFYAKVTARTNVTYTMTISAAVSNTTNGPNVEIMHSHANYSKDASASIVPSPGAGGMLTVTQISIGTVLACWVSAPQTNVSYDLFYYHVQTPELVAVGDVDECTAECCKQPGSCGMLTPIGMVQNVVENRADQVRLEVGEAHDAGSTVGPSSVICKKVPGLKSSGTYVFNVVANAPHKLRTAYSGVTASLKYTIIAAAHDELIILWVLLGVVGVFAVLIALIIAGKIFMECYIRRQKTKRLELDATNKEAEADAAEAESVAVKASAPLGSAPGSKSGESEGEGAGAGESAETGAAAEGAREE